MCSPALLKLALLCLDRQPKEEAVSRIPTNRVMLQLAIQTPPLHVQRLEQHPTQGAERYPSLSIRATGGQRLGQPAAGATSDRLQPGTFHLLSSEVRLVSRRAQKPCSLMCSFLQILDYAQWEGEGRVSKHKTCKGHGGTGNNNRGKTPGAESQPMHHGPRHGMTPARPLDEEECRMEPTALTHRELVSRTHLDEEL